MEKCACLHLCEADLFFSASPPPPFCVPFFTPRIAVALRRTQVLIIGRVSRTRVNEFPQSCEIEALGAEGRPAWSAEPNVVSQTAHSVARRGARGRRELLSDGELRELLSELLCHVRTAHVLPLSAEALLSAQRRGLLPRPPPCMLGGEEPPPRGGASAGWLGTGRGPHARPRLFAPYVEEAKVGASLGETAVTPKCLRRWCVYRFLKCGFSVSARRRSITLLPVGVRLFLFLPLHMTVLFWRIAPSSPPKC